MTIWTIDNTLSAINRAYSGSPASMALEILRHTFGALDYDGW